jgi:hypothetical protein
MIRLNLLFKYVVIIASFMISMLKHDSLTLHHRLKLPRN